MRLILALLISATAYAISLIPGSDIRSVSSIDLINKGKHGSALYSISATGSSYSEAPYLLDLHGATPFEQGFDAGFLTHSMMTATYESLMHALFGNNWYESIEEGLLGMFLDWQWNDYLSKQTPDEYLEELRGLTAGGRAAGQVRHDLGKLAARGIVLANFPGNISHITIILKQELLDRPSSHGLTQAQSETLIKSLSSGWQGLSCSMFGAWGSRTQSGRLFSGRNLDWFRDSGISVNKLVTVYHPANGFSHATFGWAGLWGAITGISSKGVTVHEANLESDDITFNGFPWVLRLRHVMAHATTIDEALTIWQSTNSTVGFNHGIGSGADGKFVCLETMKGSNAVFSANDPREQNLIVNGQQIGAPRQEAVYRTNHGYDAYTVAHYIDSPSSYSNSISRYLAFPEAFDSYAASGKLIGHVEAVNITAVIASKGNNFYQCVIPFTGGSNILSVAYDPVKLTAYSAWESGKGDSWAPAACSSYLALDLSSWF